MAANSTDLNTWYTASQEWTHETASEEYAFDFKQRIGVSVIYCLIVLVGVTGNACVILAVLFSRKLHTPTNILVVNLSVTDFITCWSLLIQIVVLLNSDHVLRLVPRPLCLLASGVTFVGTTCSLMTLTLIAFMRWYVITHSIRGHTGLHTTRKVATMVVFVWTTSLIVSLLPPGLGIGTLGYSITYKQCCTVDDNLIVKYYSMVQGCGSFILVMLAVYFYTSIFLFVCKNDRKFTQRFSHGNDSCRVNELNSDLKEGSKTEGDTHFPTRSLSYMVENGHHQQDQSETERRMVEQFRKREIKLTKNLFVVFFIFVVCLVPFSISLAIPGGSIVNIYFAVVVYCNSCVNPLIYCLKHDQFKEVLRPLLRCRWSKIPQPTQFIRHLFPSDQHSEISNIYSLSG
ncbi:somatostatin receptor type 2-like [Lytechinus pictus]|uniref:somatostatin receptor type 2-like n=1 Tax=Lytechinus pictus TaxID=7653 RepID=UPI0030B9DE2A